MDWTPQRISELATGYWRSAALSAAIELGLFDALAAGEADAGALASRCGADPDYLADLLDACVGLELLDKRGDRYRLPDAARPYLVSDSPTSMVGALRFNAMLYPLWGRLAGSVRDGAPALPPTHLGDDPARTEGFVMGMHSRAAALAPRLAPHVPLADSVRVLDLAAGPGTFARALADRYPSLSLTLFDLPGVLAIARRLGEGTDAAGRLRYIDGDYRRDPLPGGHDTVFYCGALHQESPESAARLFESVYRVLPSDGRLVVVDLMLDDTGTAPAFSALFSLNMRLTSPAGRVFRTSDVTAILRRVGFCDATVAPAPGTPYHVASARRPESPGEPNS